jgi:hypothetical protein
MKKSWQQGTGVNATMRVARGNLYLMNNGLAAAN